ncbi:MAG: diguanylate cyclase/phosphodiesterase with and sensor(s), partial [Proteobacteria bacterium]|nr:diguanylate cyclase/phosphodiesterase with and sensor(s) [Pseudomonadota bacterium]
MFTGITPYNAYWENAGWLLILIGLVLVYGLIKYLHSSISNEVASIFRSIPFPPGKKSGKAVLLFILLTLLTSASSYSVFLYQRSITIASAKDNLNAIAELKVKQITTWLSGRQSDAEALRHDKFLSYYLGGAGEALSPPDAEKALRERMSSLQQLYRYDDIQLFDAEGKLRAFVNSDQVMPREQEVVRQALNTRHTVFSDLFLSPGPAKSHLDFAVPIPAFADEQTIAGVILLRSNPEEFLYPLIQSWPTPSRTA